MSKAPLLKDVLGDKREVCMKRPTVLPGSSVEVDIRIWRLAEGHEWVVLSTHPCWSSYPSRQLAPHMGESLHPSLNDPLTMIKSPLKGWLDHSRGVTWSWSRSSHPPEGWHEKGGDLICNRGRCKSCPPTFGPYTGVERICYMSLL